MKITCSKDTLANALTVVGRSASTRAGVQIASGVRISATDPEAPVELAATDLELAVRMPLVADIAEPGTVVVSARLLGDIVRSLRAGTVTLEAEAGGRLRVVSGSSRFDLHTFPAEDFPRLPDIDPEHTFDVPGDVLLGTIEHVVRAASKDDSRPVLTGVLVLFEPGRLTMAATDSYRLAVKETALEQSAPEPAEAIVPARALAEAQRLISAGSTVEVGIAQNHVAFGVDGTWLTARRIEGQFPNFRSLVPDRFEHEVTVARDELSEVVGRVSVLARNNAPIRLRFADGELRVACQTPDVGEAEETVPVAYAGEPFEIGFNAEFLRDGLVLVDTDDVRLRLISPLRPALVQGPGDDLWYLIMPIRLT